MPLSWCFVRTVKDRQAATFTAMTADDYFAPDRGAEYCDERVCLSECFSVRDHIFGTTRPIFTNFLRMSPVAMARSSCGDAVIR